MSTTSQDPSLSQKAENAKATVVDAVQGEKDNAGVDRSVLQKTKDFVGVDKSAYQEASDAGAHNKSMAQQATDLMSGAKN
jgi:hypothetical protein